ncbi:MAG: Gfo/Idh/MocA family oxidoreductase [Defluviitaleaceae bacterium]|nr:Gfo/Idh/MocA family oxidoreductase [Defluviitaleaceae bacterium]
MGVNVGILGFAHGHVMAFGGEWAKDKSMGVTITKGWDRDFARAESGAKTLGAAPVNSIEEILGDRQIGAVVIASETKYHAELAELAAAAGKAIIMYKPIALTMNEADRVVAAVAKHGVPFTLGYQMRVDPQNLKIKQLADEKVLGKLSAYRRRHALATHSWPGFEDTWHVSPEMNRDIFADDSSHPIDMLNWIFGLPETVSAEFSTVQNPKVVNDTGVALFKYPSGMIAEISCYFACCVSEPTTEVYGEKGTILQYYGDGPGTRLPRAAGQAGLKWFIEGDTDWTDSKIESPKSHGERLVAQARPFAEFLQGKRPPICSAEEGRDSLRMVLACYVSARNGRRVGLDDPEIYGV